METTVRTFSSLDVLAATSSSFLASSFASDGFCDAVADDNADGSSCHDHLHHKSHVVHLAISAFLGT